MHYVYVLFSKKDNKIYIGFSNDLKSRMAAHIGGFVKATKSRRPLVLIYYEAYGNELDARRREKYLKGGNGREVLKIQLKEMFESVGYRYPS